MTRCQTSAFRMAPPETSWGPLFSKFSRCRSSIGNGPSKPASRYSSRLLRVLKSPSRLSCIELASISTSALRSWPLCHFQGRRLPPCSFHLPVLTTSTSLSSLVSSCSGPSVADYLTRMSLCYCHHLPVPLHQLAQSLNRSLQLLAPLCHLSLFRLGPLLRLWILPLSFFYSPSSRH